jgi:cysteine desulfurase/selenocysteine lyase
VAATARASFYVYNTKAEVDAIIDGLDHAQSIFG